MKTNAHQLILCDKRRKKIADVLADYEQRVQFSVFEYVLKDKNTLSLHFCLKDRVDLKKDSVRFYPLSGHTSEKVEV